MRYFVNDNCIGCGLCASICPDVFKMSDSGRSVASVNDVATEHLKKAKEAAESCPVDAIEEC